LTADKHQIPFNVLICIFAFQVMIPIKASSTSAVTGVATFHNWVSTVPSPKNFRESVHSNWF